MAALRTGNFELLFGSGSDDDRHIWRYAEETEEKGEEITLFRWHLYLAFPAAMVIVHYSLVFLTSMVEERIIRMIIGQMEQQISSTEVRLDLEAMRRLGHMHEGETIAGRVPRD